MQATDQNAGTTAWNATAANTKTERRIDMSDFTDLTLKKHALRLTAEQPALLFCEYSCGGYVTMEQNLRGRDKLTLACQLLENLEAEHDLDMGQGIGHFIGACNDNDARKRLIDGYDCCEGDFPPFAHGED